MAKEYEYIKKQDKKVYDAILGEEKREAEGLELIPSENYVSRAVREANGSIFTKIAFSFLAILTSFSAINGLDNAVAKKYLSSYTALAFSAG